jgi:hypothetical protein
MAVFRQMYESYQCNTTESTEKKAQFNCSRDILNYTVDFA